MVERKLSSSGNGGTQQLQSSLNLSKTSGNISCSAGRGRGSDIDDANLILQNDPNIFLKALAEQLVKCQSRNVGCASRAPTRSRPSNKWDEPPDNNVLIARMNEGCDGNTGKQDAADDAEHEERRDESRRVLNAIRQVGDVLSVMSVGAAGENSAASVQPGTMECIGEKNSTTDGKLDSKRTLVAYFKEHYHPNKESAWETDIIDDDDEEKEDSMELEESGTDLDDCDLPRYEKIFEKIAQGNTLEQQRKTSSNGKRKGAVRRRQSRSDCCREDLDTIKRGSREHVLACATAAITSKLAFPTIEFVDGQVDRQRRHSRDRQQRAQSMQKMGPSRRFKEMLAEDERVRAYRRRSTYFNYPSFSMDTSDIAKTNSVKTSIVSPSDMLDTNSNFSKTNLTSPRSPSDRRGSVQLSLDKLGLLVKGNLVATMISVYILVSLTVIVVLILPYLFRGSPPTGTLESSGHPIMLVDLPAMAAQESVLPNIKTRPPDDDIGETGKHTQTEPPGRASQPVVLLNNSALRSLEISSTPKPSRKTGSPSPTTNSYLKTSDSDSHRTSDRVSANEPSSQSKQMNHNKGRGTRVSSDQTEEPLSATKNRTAPLRELYYRKLWSVVHNQQCQPLKVSFCSRSIESMYNGLSLSTSLAAAGLLASNNKLAQSVGGYDKTLLPNQFTMTRQSQVDTLLQGYEPIIDIKCYPLMPLFLCSIYAPKCIPVNQSEIDSWHNHQRIPLESLHMITKVGNEEETAIKTGSETTNTIEFPDQLNRNLSSKSSPANGGQNTSRGFMPPANKNYARLVPPCRSLCIGMNYFKFIFNINIIVSTNAD